MGNQIKRLCRLVLALHEQEAAQRKFIRAIYAAPSRVPDNYQRPAYLRRARVAGQV